MTNPQNPAIKPPQEPGYSLSMAVLGGAYSNGLAACSP